MDFYYYTVTIYSSFFFQSSHHSRCNNHLKINAPNVSVSSNNSLMSNISTTPIWRDSIDSISCTEIICPLLKQSGCKNIITSDAVLEHLSEIHEIPQVHFYSICAKLPIPLPFGSEAVYILHYGEDLFFFQVYLSILLNLFITCKK